MMCSRRVLVRSVVLLALALTACGDDTRPGSPSTRDAGARDAALADAAVVPDDAAQDAAPDATTDAALLEEDAGLIWPHPDGPANGSAFLRDHHRELRAIRPRVLVLDVVQREGLVPVGELLDGLVDGFAEMSRHRAFADSSAPAFLQYRIDRVVDLRDPEGAEYPAFWPPSTPSGFDIGEIFGDEFATRIGYEDPDVPGRMMPMCELFERGLINELWIAADAAVRNVFENQSRLQVYGDDGEPVEGRFDECSNGCLYDPLERVSCGVSVRIQELNKGRGPGCGIHAAGHTLEHTRFVQPYLRDNATRFLGFDLDTRYGLERTNLYECPYTEGVCVERAAPNRFASGALWPYAAFDVSTWGDACGSVHFPPNARSHYDYYSDLPAFSTCESYGTGGLAGDVVDTYTWSKVSALEAAHPDCGGGWLMYWGQAMPGLDNVATDSDGEPMKNWWPFLFY